MTVFTIALKYKSHTLDAVQMGGQIWLGVGQLVPPLGLSTTNSISKIYHRNADEFTVDETRVISLPTEGGMQDVRVFSLRGVRLLALLARTPEAKAFRRWVLDLLEGRVRRRPADAQLALPGTFAPATEALRMLDEVSAAIEPEHPAQDVIRSLRDGSRPISEDPTLIHFASQYAGAVSLLGEGQRVMNAIYNEARRVGYSREAVKIAYRTQRAAGNA